MTGQNSNHDGVENRQEIIFLYDALNTNPNGNPLGASNKPRIDSRTQKAVVTDVRLKRYLRDQLYDDGHNILIKSPTQMYNDENAVNKAATREKSVDDLLDEMLEVAGYDDVDEFEDGELFEKFLQVATDVRYFGATLSLDDDNHENDWDSDSLPLPQSIEGPLQFQHARSLNKVSENTESQKLTSVLSSDESNQQGTMADDHRLEYAIFAFNGILNENTADFSLLEKDDVERLDHLLWRSIKNQTVTRSKVGQDPVLYVRIEYNSEYHNGRLNRALELSSEKDDTEIRSLSDYALDVTEFVNQLSARSNHIENVHLTQNPRLNVEYEGENYESVGDVLEKEGIDTNIVDPYEKYEN